MRDPGQQTNAELDTAILDKEAKVDQVLEDDAEIKRLASLSPLEYEREREGAAGKLGISRVSALDTIVKAVRPKADTTSALYPHWAVEPWGEVVNTDSLLRAVLERIQRHVFLTRQQAVAVALWVMMTWVHERAAVHSPILFATSAEANSGKSTLLGVMSFMVLRGMLNVAVSGPVLYRLIEKYGPTLLQDEGDSAFVDNEDLRAIYNSGWTRGQGVPRCHPVTLEPQVYGTFAPKGLGMKGRKLPDTTLSRCIVIEMKRKLKTEVVADFSHIDDEGFQRLRRQLRRWSEDNAHVLAESEPEVPDGFENRVRMNWWLLFAIAERAGGQWKAEAWSAARAIEKLRATFESSIGVQLLADIRRIFRSEPKVTEIRSKDLVAELVAIENSPWVEYSKGKPLTMTKMARLISSYSITTVTVHPDVGPHGSGYKLADLEPVFERYLPPETDPLGENPAFKVCNSANPDEMVTSSDFQSLQETSLQTLKNDELANNDGHLQSCRLQNLETASKDGRDPSRHEVNDWHRDHPETGSHDHCSQCRGSGPPLFKYVAHGTTVWLHPECKHFWLKERQERAYALGNPTTSSGSSEPVNGEPRLPIINCGRGVGQPSVGPGGSDDDLGHFTGEL